MKVLQVMGAAAVAGVIALIPSLEASAAGLTDGSYSAFQYADGEHAFWLQGLSRTLGYGSNSPDWIFDNPDTPEVETGLFELDSDGFSLSGRIFYEFDADAYWDLDLSFSNRPIGQAIQPKIEGPIVGVDTTDWRYFNLDEPGVLIGGGVLDGLALGLWQRPRPEDETYGTQVGIGANNKDPNVAGMSTWLTWGLYRESRHNPGRYHYLHRHGHGDINIRLECISGTACDPVDDIPEPFTIVGSLIAVGAGATALKRKRDNAIQANEVEG